MVCLIDANKLMEYKAPAPWTRYVRILIDPEKFKQTPLSLALFRYEPGQVGPQHSHQRETEIYFTIEGTGIVEVDNKEYEVKQMTILYIPPGAIHQSRNPGNKDWIFIAIHVPPYDYSAVQKWTQVERDPRLG